MLQAQYGAHVVAVVATTRDGFAASASAEAAGRACVRSRPLTARQSHRVHRPGHDLARARPVLTVAVVATTRDGSPRTLLPKLPAGCACDHTPVAAGPALPKRCRRALVREHHTAHEAAGRPHATRVPGAPILRWHDDRAYRSTPQRYLQVPDTANCALPHRQHPPLREWRVLRSPTVQNPSRVWMRCVFVPEGVAPLWVCGRVSYPKGPPRLWI